MNSSLKYVQTEVWFYSIRTKISIMSVLVVTMTLLLIFCLSQNFPNREILNVNILKTMN